MIASHCRYFRFVEIVTKADTKILIWWNPLFGCFKETRFHRLFPQRINKRNMPLIATTTTKTICRRRLWFAWKMTHLGREVGWGIGLVTTLEPPLNPGWWGWWWPCYYEIENGNHKKIWAKWKWTKVMWKKKKHRPKQKNGKVTCPDSHVFFWCVIINMPLLDSEMGIVVTIISMTFQRLSVVALCRWQNSRITTIDRVT